MIVSAHHLTGFWFESDLRGQQDADQESASEFLAASVNTLQKFKRGEGQSQGAINTGFDPARLSTDLPGYRWLKDNLQWMKQTFEDFDDEPGGELKDPKKRRNPFPAFHWTIQSPVGDRQLSLDGIQALVGHDFVVIHEFSVSPLGLGERALDEIGLAMLSEKRFAAAPESSAALFTAAFVQLSDLGERQPCGDLVEAVRIFNTKITELALSGQPTVFIGDWSQSDFTAGRCPGVKLPLRCAVSGDDRRYRGCILVDGSKWREEDYPTHDLDSQIQAHINASAYLTFFCTLLVNYSKVQYEYHVMDRAFEELKHSLVIRYNDAEELRRACSAPGPQSFSNASINALSAAHLADQKLLNRFEQLVDTCLRNTEQFGLVASQLMESDNRWTAYARRRMNHENTNLLAAQKELRNLFDNTKAYLDELRRATAVAIAPPASATKVDEKLLQLRNCLRDQFRHCNDFCLAFAEFRLFAPSQEALDELFEHEIHVPVASKRDFRSFIIVLHMVFDEALPEVLRRWKPGQQLPEPLTRVARVLHADEFDQLTVLRNKFAAHDALQGDAAKATKKLSQVYENLIGVRTVARFDAHAWLGLQKAVLEMLSAVLEKLLQIFEQHQNSTRKPRGN